ncbi:MAG: hypothetical protein JWM87_768 [Candidatus Eremiobacteraeota bacterium]|nr:hypothetical protein [Candidatus Eremiobacteraeota bacterium]
MEDRFVARSDQMDAAGRVVCDAVRALPETDAEIVLATALVLVTRDRAAETIPGVERALRSGDTRTEHEIRALVETAIELAYIRLGFGKPYALTVSEQYDPAKHGDDERRWQIAAVYECAKRAATIGATEREVVEFVRSAFSHARSDR